ncbi:hypothetical protein [Rheinheimera gaetbuli]
MTKVMFVASGGGHWVQLRLLDKQLGSFERVYVSTLSDFKVKDKMYIVKDCSFKEKIELLRCLFQILKIVRKEKPTTIFTTGAAPGILAVMCGRLFGINTIWVDSIANAEQLSLSGKLARRISNVCCSQWEDVAIANNVMFLGRVV